MPGTGGFPTSVSILSGLLLTAGAGMAISAGRLSPGNTGPEWLAGILLVALVAAGVFQLEFHYRRHVEAIDLFEAVLTPVLVLFSGPIAVGVAVLAKAVSQRI